MSGNQSLATEVKTPQPVPVPVPTPTPEQLPIRPDYYQVVQIRENCLDLKLFERSDVNDEAPLYKTIQLPQGEFGEKVKELMQKSDVDVFVTLSTYQNTDQNQNGNGETENTEKVTSVKSHPTLSSFLQLPVEMILEIMYCLTSRDLLRFRLICTYFTNFEKYS